MIPNSPADLAGLLPYGDYVIGSPEGLVRGESGLGELVEDVRFPHFRLPLHLYNIVGSICANTSKYLNRPLRLIVYNHEYNVTRPITITPARGWGGEGALGCVLGFGALHRIPESLEEPVQGPGETLFSTDSASFDEKRPVSSSSNIPLNPGLAVGANPELFVPANMALPSKSPPPPPGAGAGTGPPKGGKRAKQRAHAALSPSGGGGLDDYFKEGEKKSQEQDFSPAGKGNVPPPPKVGGPPRGPPKSATPVQTEPTTEE